MRLLVAVVAVVFALCFSGANAVHLFARGGSSTFETPASNSTSSKSDVDALLSPPKPSSSSSSSASASSVSSSASSSAASSAASAAAGESNGLNLPQPVTLQARLDAKKKELSDLLLRIEELKVEIAHRDGVQTATAKELVPFFSGDAAAFSALNNYFHYYQRQRDAAQDVSMTAKIRDAAAADETADSGRAKSHRALVETHLAGNDAALTLFHNLIQQRESLLDARFEKQLNLKKKAVLEDQRDTIKAQIDSKNLKK
eukprot:comp10211_c0_seq1/m.12240 comp10211_c0_seq1/g.12240  ORF comp10211_c0_seq1/g.12240 comp10211_c0_seq1/m.12240 type:complete len:258 (+) comp10211_c0_seq1:133-906(+)